MFYAYPDSQNTFSGTFNFVDYSTGLPVSWFWDFGDGTNSTQQNPVHTYSAQGTYSVCLTITTQSSGSCTTCDTIAYKVLGMSETNNPVASIKNYPNPFSKTTTIFYSLKEKTEVNISVYSDMGLKVAELENGNKESGNHQLEWNAEHLTSGVYFLEIKSGGNIVSRKMILIK
jgi:PKD repeat protein